MIKYFPHKGREFRSIEVEGIPYAYMEEILDFIIEDTWSAYQQVLNGNDSLVSDLELICVDNDWLVPVSNIKAWMFSVPIISTDPTSETYSKFRKYRKGIDELYKILWAQESTADILINLPDTEFIEPRESEMTLWDIHNIFASYDIPDTILEGCDLEGKIFGPLHYIQLIVSSTECGPRGSLLADQLDYIENLPFGDEIWAYLDEVLLTQGIPPMAIFLDEYLDRLNVHISYQLMKFIGDIQNA